MIDVQRWSINKISPVSQLQRQVNSVLREFNVEIEPLVKSLIFGEHEFCIRAIAIKANWPLEFDDDGWWLVVSWWDDGWWWVVRFRIYPLICTTS